MADSGILKFRMSNNESGCTIYPKLDEDCYYRINKYQIEEIEEFFNVRIQRKSDLKMFNIAECGYKMPDTIKYSSNMSVKWSDLIYYERKADLSDLIVEGMSRKRKKLDIDWDNLVLTDDCEVKKLHYKSK